MLIIFMVIFSLLYIYLYSSINIHNKYKYTGYYGITKLFDIISV
jgi:hypothetical protein